MLGVLRAIAWAAELKEESLSTGLTVNFPSEAVVDCIVSIVDDSDL